MNKKLVLIALLSLPLPAFSEDNLGTAFISFAIGGAFVVTGGIFAGQAVEEYKKAPQEKIKQMLSQNKKADGNTITININEVKETFFDKVKKYGWVYAKGIPAFVLIMMGMNIARN